MPFNQVEESPKARQDEIPGSPQQMKELPETPDYDPSIDAHTTTKTQGQRGKGAPSMKVQESKPTNESSPTKNDVKA